MTQTNIASFFQTTRDFPKYVINQDRELKTVAPFNIAIDHSPNSGKRLGILVEQGSTNHFTDSENMVVGVQKSANVAINPKSIAGSPCSASISASREMAYIGCNTNITTSHVAISFYVLQSNLQRPVIGYSEDENTTIVIRLNDADINIGASNIEVQGPMNDLSYRVRIVVPFYAPVTNFKIMKTARQSIGFQLSRIQVEPQVCTSYIPTTGTVKSRLAETVYRNLTHGVDINEDQGTFDVLFSASHNSKGSAMMLSNHNTSEFLAFGHQYDESGYPEALRFSTMSTHIPVPLRHHNEAIRKRYTGIRACYSGYGVRGVVNKTPFIAHLKALDSFQTYKYNRLSFGESYDGTHFSGHIHLINAYARTFTDDELLNMTFVPNDTSLDVDYGLEDSAIFSTAAAIFRTDAEALLYQNVVEPPTPQRILAAWPRASDSYLALNPDNATGNGKLWYFDPVSYSFTQPANSGQIESILSPIKLSEYKFECVLNSNDDHPDAIGLIAAANEINGQLYYIVIAIDGGGYGMTINNNRVNRFGMYLHTPQTPVGWGKFGEELAGNNFLRKNGWTNRVKMKVVRQNTFLSVVVSDWNGTDYDPRSELVYNLATLKGVAAQLGTQPARYGFMSHSTPGARFLDYELTSSQAINEMKIYSLESNSYWRFESTGWKKQATTATADILPSTRIYNKVTNEAFLIDETTLALKFHKNSGISYGEATITVPKSKTTDIDMNLILDQFEYEDELFLFNVYGESNIIAEQIVIGGVTKLRLVTKATGGSFVALIGTEPNTNAFGIREEIVAFRTVKVLVV